MNSPVLSPLPGDPLPVPPGRPDPPKGFLDCRGEWQDLDDKDHDAAP